MNLTKEQVIEEIKRGKSLQDFPEWCDDKEVVLEAVKQNGYSLKYASYELKNDKEIVLEAVKQEKFILHSASQEIKDKIGDNNPVLFLEQWIKKEKAKELDSQLDKKENKDKIKL